jgi:hypothetical protein
MVRQLAKFNQQRQLVGKNHKRQVHPHRCSGDSISLTGKTGSQSGEAGIKGGNSESDRESRRASGYE